MEGSESERKRVREGKGRERKREGERERQRGRKREKEEIRSRAREKVDEKVFVLFHSLCKYIYVKQKVNLMENWVNEGNLTPFED